MEGRRPLLAEVQAPGDPAAAERPRRTTSRARLAPGSRWCSPCSSSTAGIRLHSHDVFASTVGGARLTEPASDLAVARRARLGVHRAWPRRRGVVAMGEIGLAGELRRVRDLPQRIAEAARLGFAVAVVPGTAQRARSPRRATSTGCA